MITEKIYLKKFVIWKNKIDLILLYIFINS